jgi:ankyrin repeat protein
MNFYTELQLAAMHGDAGDFERALRACGGRADVIDAPTPMGGTALLLAVEGDRVEEVAALVRAGADARRRKPTGAGALTLAAEFCFTDTRMVDLLCGRCGLEAAGAEFHNGSTPLHVAATAGNAAAFSALLRHGADAKARDRGGETVLHALFTNMEYPQRADSQWTEAKASMLGDLLDLGVDVDAECGASGMTAAHIAVQKGSFAGFELLAARGADLAKRDAGGQTPADKAFVVGRVEFLEFLHARGLGITPGVAQRRGVVYSYPLYRETPDGGSTTLLDDAESIQRAFPGMSAAGLEACDRFAQRVHDEQAR